MTEVSRDGFTFEFSKNEGPRTLLLLHGTGGNERDILALGPLLDEKAHLIAPRGKVQEDGMLRFFKRSAPGIFDRTDLKLRTEELSLFIVEMEDRYSIPTGSMIGVGYSNGANILLHLLCLYPERMRAAILLRPMSAGLSENLPVFENRPVFIGAGAKDTMVDPGDSKILANALQQSNAGVVLHVSDAGHGLSDEDIAAARTWLHENS